MLRMKQETKKKLVEEIQDFFEVERDEKIGIIAAEELLEFFLDTVGKEVYNKALDDARLWMEKRVDEVRIDYDILYKE